MTDIYDVLAVLERLEKKVDELDKRVSEINGFIKYPRGNEAFPAKIKSWTDKIPDDCMHKNFKPNEPVGISCPCPRCSPYSMKYTEFTNGDLSKFTSGSIISSEDKG